MFSTASSSCLISKIGFSKGNANFQLSRGHFLRINILDTSAFGASCKSRGNEPQPTFCSGYAATSEMAGKLCANSVVNALFSVTSPRRQLSRVLLRRGAVVCGARDTLRDSSKFLRKIAVQQSLFIGWFAVLMVVLPCKSATNASGVCGSRAWNRFLFAKRDLQENRTDVRCYWSDICLDWFIAVVNE